MRIPALLIPLILCSCQASGGSGPDQRNVRYSVKRNRADAKAKVHYVVEATLSGRGSRIESHILAVYDTKWVTLNLGEAPESGREIEIAGDADDPLPAEVGQFTGKILAVRCKEAGNAKVDVDFRVYEVQHGHVVAKKRSKDPLAEGEIKELELPW